LFLQHGLSSARQSYGFWRCAWEIAFAFFPKMARFRLSAFGLPAFPSATTGPPRPHRSTGQCFYLGRNATTSACITTSPLPSFSLRDVGATSADPLSRIGSPRHRTSGSKQGTRMGAVCNSQRRVVPPYTALFILTFWLRLGLDSDAPGFDRARSLRRKPLSRFPSRLERCIRTRKQIIKYIYLVRYTKPNLAFYIPTPVFVPSSHLASSLCLLAGYVG